MARKDKNQPKTTLGEATMIIRWNNNKLVLLTQIAKSRKRDRGARF